MKRIEALVFWVKNRFICGELLSSNDFTHDILDNVQANMIASQSCKNAEDEIASKSHPGKLQSNNLKWVDWKKKLVNHLYNICGTRGMRLIYIIQNLLLKPLTPYHQFVDEDERMIWSAITMGPKFRVDNTNLCQIIERCCIGTDGATWIHQASNTKDGFLAISSLCQQFNGWNMKQKRKTYAKQQLRILHYRNEKTSMKFDRFAAYLKDAFDIMEDCGIIYPKEPKINTLFEKVRACTYFNFQSCISLLCTNPNGTPLTFDNVVSQLSEAITSSIASDPTHQQQQRRSDRRGIYTNTSTDQRSHVRARGGRNTTGRGSATGRGAGRHSQDRSKKRTVVNGVDCTDLTRWYSNEEFHKLPTPIQNSIKDAKAQCKHQCSTSGASSTPPNKAQRIINSIETILSGTGNPTDDVSALPLDSGASSDPAPTNSGPASPGDAFGRHAYTQNSSTTSCLFDHRHPTPTHTAAY